MNRLALFVPTVSMNFGLEAWSPRAFLVARILTFSAATTTLESGHTLAINSSLVTKSVRVLKEILKHGHALGLQVHRLGTVAASTYLLRRK